MEIQCNADYMVYSHKSLHFLLQNISHCDGTPVCYISPWCIFIPINIWAGLHVAMTFELEVNAWFDSKVVVKQS